MDISRRAMLRLQRRRLHQISTGRPHRCLSAIPHADLPQDMLYVFFDGLVADVEDVPNILVAHAVD